MIRIPTGFFGYGRYYKIKLHSIEKNAPDHIILYTLYCICLHTYKEEYHIYAYP